MTKRLHSRDGSMFEDGSDYKASEDDLLEKKPKFCKYDKNFYLDLESKRAALSASPSVVSLVSYTGEEELREGCGTIIEIEDDNMNVVITSAKLIRRPTNNRVCENSLADDLKVDVFASDEKSYKGEICAYDFHYNLAVVKFQSDTSLSAAIIRAIDDSVSVCPSKEKLFHLRPHIVKLVPNDLVITVGRYFAKPYELMAAPGSFCADPCDWDCKELFHVTCTITSCGDGSALVNRLGEMVGVVFYGVSSVSTLCIPINIAQKWWDHYKIHRIADKFAHIRTRESRHPYLGFEACNLYIASLPSIDIVIRRFPSISEGVTVTKVTPGSYAESAGLQCEDIILKCEGRDVGGFLELWEAMWEKVGRTVELVVARTESKSFLNLNMMVVEATSNNLNSWPQRRIVHIVL